MMTYADIFSGCGGLSYGFYHTNGYRGLLATDHWEIAKKVYNENQPNTKFEIKDLYSESNVRTIISMLKDKCDILLGGPPCQGFSSLGKRRDDDKRSTLVETFLHMAVVIKPKLIIMENVRGITSKAHKSGLNFPAYIKRVLQNEQNDAQYDIKYVLIDTIEFGLAQTRVRWIMIAVRKNINKDENYLNRIIASIDQQKVVKKRVLKDVISDLPYIESGEGAERIAIEGEKKLVIFNHIAMKHSKDLLKRFSYVPVGGGLLDVPKELLPNHLRKMVDGEYGSGGHIKNIYGRLDWNLPCGTIVAGIDKITCGRYLHPTANRLLTPRECARIQSFPDRYRFFGSLVNQYYLIGNAVPPKISKVLAKAIKQAFQKTNIES